MEELSKAKGLLSERRDKDTSLTVQVVAVATSANSWIAVCDAIGD